MKAALLTIGDELLIGQVLNSNVQWISERLIELGIKTEAHLTVGDEEPAIKQALNFLSNHDVIIIGGGLGPTHDDITLEVLSQHYQLPLTTDDDWLKQVKDYFKARNRVMAENNKKQALLLKSAVRIDNDCGTAAGQYFQIKNLQHKNTHLFVVPGVPHEMKSMMNRFILPKLTELASAVHSFKNILKETLVVTGIGESALALKCDPVVKKIQSTPNLSLAFLPSSIQVRLRLLMQAQTDSDISTFQQFVEELKKYCGDDYVGSEPTSLQDWIVKSLTDQQQTLSTAESCTGGLVSHFITQVAGSSAVFKGGIIPYQSILKEQELGISASSLEAQGIVSEATAIQMANASNVKFKTDYAIATTGYVGPTGGDAKAKLGTVVVAVAGPSETIAKTFYLENNRERNKERTAQAALDLLRRQILKAQRLPK
jgi:nicotinamide-nucleotide amidase